MKRFFFGFVLFILAGILNAETSWKGQAEVWLDPSVPTQGYYAASNQFPNNSIVNVENIKTQKSIKVRVVSPLPTGNANLVALSPQAASAIGMKSDDNILVNVLWDTSEDTYRNLDDLAGAKDKTDAEVPVAAPVAAAVPVTPVPVTPAIEAPAAEAPKVEAPKAETAAKETAPVDVPVEPEASVVVETPAAAPAAIDSASVAAAPLQTEEESETASPEVKEPLTQPDLASKSEDNSSEPAKTTEVQTPAVKESIPETVVPALVPTPAAPVTAAIPPAVPDSAAASAPVVSSLGTVNLLAHVAVPDKLKGPILGNVAWVDHVEKGKAYVQVAVFKDEAGLSRALENIKSFVPMSVLTSKDGSFQLIAQSSNAQLGILMMHYRSQGYKAQVIKG